MKQYLKSCQTDFWRQIFKKELEYLLKELKGYKSVLSIGCGPAIIENGLQEHRFDVTGFDISQEALEETPDSIKTIVGSAENLNLPNSRFDAVIYIASLQFIDDYKKAIQETSKVLKPKGKLLTMLLNPESKFFKEKRKQPNSYLNKIKHTYLKPIEEVIQKYYDNVKAEYYLGIKNEKIFLSDDPKLAALYILQGVKK